MYRIIGGDGIEYGPISAEQLRQWVSEGRVNAQTQVQAEGSGEWKPLSTYQELVVLGSRVPAPTPAYVAPASPKTSGYAITSLVLGLVGWVCCGPILCPLGIVFSCMALSQIKKNPAQYTGRGMAIAGLVLAIVGLVLSVAWITFWFMRGGLDAIRQARS